GWWLVPWCAAGVLLGSRRRRWLHLAAWGLAGVVLAGLLCGSRLGAEYYWQQARHLEGCCQYDAARGALQKAVALFPECGRLERTWLLEGKLDHRQGRATRPERFFRAYQLTRDKVRPRAVAYREDLPWLIDRTQDYREGLEPPSGGFDQT